MLDSTSLCVLPQIATSDLPIESNKAELKFVEPYEIDAVTPYGAHSTALPRVVVRLWPHPALLLLSPASAHP